MHRSITKIRSSQWLLSRPRLHHVSLGFAVATISLSFWLAHKDWTQDSVLQLGSFNIFQYSLLALCMLLCWCTGPKTNALSDYKALIVVAILARIMLIPIDSYSSNDIDRYLFDGKMAISGFDPYRISHDAPPLVALREQWQPPAEHAQYTTVYPPLALGLFALAASAGIDSAALVWKLLVTVASLGILWLMIQVLGFYQCLRHLPLLALSPLLILETGVGAHLDVFSTLAISAALYFYTDKRWFGTGIAIGIGALCKILPIVLLLPFVLSVRRFSHQVILVSGAVITLFVGYGGAFLAGFQPLGSLPVFFQKWRNGSPLFDFMQQNMPSAYLLLSLLFLAFIGLSLVAWMTWYKSKNEQEPSLNIRALQWTLCIPLLLSPVVFPWYLMPLVPLFVLSPSVFLLLWLSLLPFTYEVLNQFASCQIWAPASWPITLLGLGMLCGLLLDWLIKPYFFSWNRAYVKTA